MKYLALMLTLLPCLLSAQSKIVVDAGYVVINSKTYEKSKLTYTLGANVKLYKFSIKALEKECEKATKLRVDYVESGQNKTQNFLGKMPKVEKIRKPKEVTENLKPDKPAKEKI